MQTPTDNSSSRQDDRESQRERGIPWLIGAIVALIPVIVVLYFIFAWKPQHDASEAQLTEQTAPPDTTSIPPVSEAPEPDLEPLTPETGMPEAEAELPELDNSDLPTLEALAELSPEKQWSAWLTTDEVIRKFVTTIDSLSQEKIARKYISIPKPAKPFTTQAKADGKEYIDPASYERYNQYADTFNSLDNEQLITLYRRFTPLLEQAFAELGNGDHQSFDDRVISAIDNLLAAPVIREPIALKPRTSVLYKYADPKLEALPSSQKQLIRMGPRNTLIIQRKLTELKKALTESR